MGGGGMMGPGMMSWMWAGMLLFWALVIGGLVLLVVWLARGVRSTNPDRAGKPLDIIRERYARGELTREDYEQSATS